MREREAPWGLSEIGVTGSTITGNLTIKTGNAPDVVGIGDGDEIMAKLAELLVDRDGDPIDLDWCDRQSPGQQWHRQHYDRQVRWRFWRLDMGRWVLIDNASAKVFRLDTGAGTIRRRSWETWLRRKR